VQGLNIEKALSGKRQTTPRGEGPLREPEWAETPNHHGPGPRRNRPPEGGQGAVAPWRDRARGARATQAARWDRPAGGSSFNAEEGGALVYLPNQAQTDLLTHIKGEMKSILHTQLIWSLSPSPPLVP
jgi:hypothetical protein